MRRGSSSTSKLTILLTSILLLANCGSTGREEAQTPAPTETSEAAPSRTDEESLEPTDAESSLGLVPTPTRARDGSVALTREMIPEDTTGGGTRIDQVTMNGVDYPAALVLYGDRNVEKIEINAGRRYERFRGSLSIPDTEDSDSSYQVDISLDGGNPAYSALVRFGETKEVDLEIDNVLRIKVELVAVGEQGGYLGIGNPRFN